MRKGIQLCALLTAIVCFPVAARADDMDEWCVRATKPSSVVICSDAELRRGAIGRNKLFETARAKLTPEAYKALLDEQWRWIKTYTAKCGVPVDGPLPPVPVPQNVIECYRQEGSIWTAYLATQLSEPNPLATAAPQGTDELNGWCAQVKKASNIVICADRELRQHLQARNKLFEAARAKLSPEAYRALNEDQQQWIRSYTARCGISIDDPPPTLPIPESVIDCYRREAHARTAMLTTRLSEPNPMAPSQSRPSAIETLGPPPSAARTNSLQGLPPCESPAGLSAIRNGGVCDRNPTPAPVAEPWKPALEEWMNCVGRAADTLAAQPEPAETVVKAALGSCGKAELELSRQTSAAIVEGVKKETVIPQLLSRVMAIRQDRNKAAAPAKAEAVRGDAEFDDWIKCTLAAANALAAQPEPAETVANAVFGSCLSEQVAYQRSAGLTDRQLEANKTAFLSPRILAQVMALRAARTKLQEGGPKTKPAIDYDRM
jgi:uncharacterized protein YecT (DUF1311 family)